MTLNDYVIIVKQNVDEYDYYSVIRSYQRYSRKHPAFTDEQVAEYIKQQIPKEAMINLWPVLEVYGTVERYIVARAQKWIEQSGEVCEETLCGIYATENAVQKLREFLNGAKPIRPTFDAACKEFGKTSTNALFTDFCQKTGKHLIRSRYHPFCADELYWNGELDDLVVLIRQWYMLYSAHVPSEIEGYRSLWDSAIAMGINPEKLLHWLWNQNGEYVVCCGRCLLQESFVQRLCSAWGNVQLVKDIVAQKLLDIPARTRAETKKRVMAWIQNEQHDWILSNGELPQQVDGVLYTSHPLVANYEITTIINTFPTIPISRLKEITSLPLKKLRTKAASGAIVAEEDGLGNWDISVNEFNRVKAVQEQYITLDEIVCSLCDTVSSTFDWGYHAHREQLVDYCNEHNWWGIDWWPCKGLPIAGEKFDIVVLREDAETLKGRMIIWIQGYGQTYSTKFRLIVERYRDKFPRTIERLVQYEKDIHPADKALIDMVDSLFLYIHKDGGLTENEIEEMLIEPFWGCESLICCDVLVDFLTYADYTRRQFTFTQERRQTDHSAYSVKNFAVMLAHVVNDSVIKQGDLISKAISNKKYADLWLFVALHMYASWRSTDFDRMIPPMLPHSPEIILEKINNKGILPQEARVIAEQFIASNSLLMNTPRKTEGTGGVPKLYFHCPQSCLDTFGIILAIATAHYQADPCATTFVKPTAHWTVVKRFFGSEFLAACGNRSFSGKRANKSLLQCVEFAGQDGEALSPSVAYYLASIMRSHKLTYGKLSETTEIYLKDAAFSGMTPSFVIYQMWERGVCSFVLDTMLKTCYGELYKKLSISQQTAAITNLGLSPAQVNGILRYVQQAEDKACEVVNSVCGSKESVKDAMKQIISGIASTKEQDGYCLCKAAGLSCKDKGRLSCTGCDFEIRTKAMLIRYAVAHRELLNFANVESEAEKNRRKYLCRTITYPAMKEILLHLDAQSEGEHRLSKELIQEVMNYGVICD